MFRMPLKAILELLSQSQATVHLTAFFVELNPAIQRGIFKIFIPKLQ